VIDQTTARPLTGARISVSGQTGVIETDLDGRYRRPALPAGQYQVRAAFIGYRPALVDSVVVRAGETTIVNITLSSAPVQLQELVAEAAVPQRAQSAAGLLAQQQSAASVSDGIAAETMQRTPDADASNAIARVTGISVVDKRFVVVRGLSERYSTTLLNGTEVASPEPLKKIVPLDLFPASLLESVVITKGLTPDKPGDFAGGLVELKTKEFPESFVAQVRVSEEYNSTGTFKKAPLIGRHGFDLLGFDDRGRKSPWPSPPEPARRPSSNGSPNPSATYGHRRRGRPCRTSGSASTSAGRSRSVGARSASLPRSTTRARMRFSPNGCSSS
jgi:hypothetical protein